MKQEFVKLYFSISINQQRVFSSCQNQELIKIKEKETAAQEHMLNSDCQAFVCVCVCYAWKFKCVIRPSERSK